MLFLVLACSSSDPPQEHHESPPKTEVAGTPTPPSTPGAAHHASHDATPDAAKTSHHDDHAHAEPGAAAMSHADHMAVMGKTRDRLREHLKDAYDAPVPGLDTANTSHGKEVYSKNCATCHGPKGEGNGPAATGLNPPPADFTDGHHARFYSDAGRVEIIRHGSPGTGMIAWEGTLSPQEILDVYAHVRTLRGD